MTIELILPDFKGTDREQLKQIRSYLYRLVAQLQFALDQTGTTAISGNSADGNIGIYTGTDEIYQKMKKLTDRIDHLESVLQNAGISTVKNTDEQQNFSEEA